MVQVYNAHEKAETGQDQLVVAPRCFKFLLACVTCVCLLLTYSECSLFFLRLGNLLHGREGTSAEMQPKSHTRHLTDT